ncbi:zinc ribbon domain-containing protein [Actinoplanes sp. NPDC048967]|uniref:zinc ribbon domain-containing protein n=1 Tax=Actinoplanes sp. NPDC048967 TaxID=3155269 RepID=UPI0033C096E8
MFLIFGFKSSDRRIAAPTLLHAYCGATVAQVLIKRTTKFSLFFIPLFPVRPARYYMQCTNCGVTEAVDAQHVAQLTA